MSTYENDAADWWLDMYMEDRLSHMGEEPEREQIWPDDGPDLWAVDAFDNEDYDNEPVGGES